MKKISRIVAGVAALSALSFAAGAKPSPEPNCVNDKVITAMQIRIAQTELMVAGLSCKQYDQWAGTANTTRYNDFVTRYRPILMNDGHKVLKRFFPTEQRLNDYLTRLANEAQLRGNANMAIFCTQASKIYDDLLNNGEVELKVYSASLPMAHKHGHNACTPPASVTPAVAPAPPEAPATPASPAAQATPPQTIATVIAANDPAKPLGGMQPVLDVSMERAVKASPRLMLKPEGI